MVDFDLIIIGSGPAGMNAALYATRANLKTLVIEKNCPGGKVVKANKVENWLGTKSVDGPTLAFEMFQHSFSYGAVYEQGNVVDVNDLGVYKEVITLNRKYTCYSVIICAGTSERKMGIPGEEKFYGKGVSYCAVCDASLYKGQVMVVAGSSDHALEEALYLSSFASKVIVVNDKKALDAKGDLIDKINNTNNIEVKNGCKVIEIKGTDNVNCVIVKEGDEEGKIETNIVFPLLGSVPDSMFATRLNIMDDKKYIIVNANQETSIQGIYAAGDCTNNSLKQIVTASGEGAVAAMQAYKYINKIKRN